MQMKQCVIFGNRLKGLRNKINMTQLELSEELKIQRVTIAKYEKGERAPTIDHLIAFAQFFNVSTDYLLGLSNASTTEMDIQFICKYTKLSELAIRDLVYMLCDEEIKILSDIIEDSSLLNIIWGLYHLDELKNNKRKINNDEELKMRLGAFHISEADMRRYCVLQQMEIILNKYDYRCMKKEVSNNGKHNPEEE